MSVSDKTALADLVKGLNDLGVEILSTGGTAGAIRDLGIDVTDVSEYTGFPEMMDGRLKTLHPKIHGGLLALRNNPEHMSQLKKTGIKTIDMVVVNLYPFEQTVLRKGVTEEEAIENIDIGGPTMLRSAAKNFRSVAVVSSPAQYAGVMEELEENDGELSAGTMRALAMEVFARTAAYDGLINEYLSRGSASRADSGETLPEGISVGLKKVKDLRYGENPHQRGALYRDVSMADGGIIEAEQLQGKELSFNNYLDLSSALDMVRGFDDPAASIVKHSNPCGVATAETLKKAYLDALDCDRMSAFGGIIGFNRPVDADMAETILEEASFVECIIAPGYEDKAIKVLEVKKNLRVLCLSDFKGESPAVKDIRRIPGGALVQDRDEKRLSLKDLKTVTKLDIRPEMMDALLFGWKVVRHVKSNAIVLCLGTRTVGIGAGQMSRVDSVKIAVRKAGARTRGAVLASDAFFPKPDSIEEAHKAGITAIIQPGGSICDEEVIAACDRFGISMVFTGIRHFKH